MQIYDEDIVTLMRKVTRPTGTTYLEEEKFETSAWEQIEHAEFRHLWNAEADGLPNSTTTKLYPLTRLLLPIWKDIPSGNERIYRVTPEGCPSMIGRTVSEDGAAALRARFLMGTPKTARKMLTAALGSTVPVDLGRGLILTHRGVAGAVRLEIDGVDRGMIDGLKALGLYRDHRLPTQGLRAARGVHRYRGDPVPDHWRGCRWIAQRRRLTGQAGLQGINGNTATELLYGRKRTDVWTRHEQDHTTGRHRHLSGCP